jgi:probable HAF family extracellular repeat protein
VGGYGDASGHTHAFLLSRGVFTSFDYPDGINTIARAINNKGDIVGVYTSVDDGQTHAFLRRRGSFTPIDIPDATTTSALGINAKAEIVGAYTNVDGGTHGFLLNCIK